MNTAQIPTKQRPNDGPPKTEKWHSTTDQAAGPGGGAKMMGSTIEAFLGGFYTNHPVRQQTRAR